MQLYINPSAQIPRGFEPYGLAARGEYMRLTVIRGNTERYVYYCGTRCVSVKTLHGTILQSFGDPIQGAEFSIVDDELELVLRGQSQWKINVSGYYSPAYNPETGTAYVLTDTGIYKIVQH